MRRYYSGRRDTRASGRRVKIVAHMSREFVYGLVHNEMFIHERTIGLIHVCNNTRVSVRRLVALEV